MGQIPTQYLIHREFGDYQIAGDTRQMEHQGLDAKPAMLGLCQFVFDNVKIPVVDIDPTALDFKPGSAVEYTATPAADFGDSSVPAKGPQVRGIETIPVVQGEVPVAVRPVGAGCSRPSQRHREHARKGRELIGDVVNK